MKTIHHVVDIDSGPGNVWRALTELPTLAAWWSTVVASPPATVGAVTRWTFEPGFNPVMDRHRQAVRRPGDLTGRREAVLS